MIKICIVIIHKYSYTQYSFSFIVISFNPVLFVVNKDHYTKSREAIAIFNFSNYNKMTNLLYISLNAEAPEGVMCDNIKIRLKRRIATTSGRGKQPLNIKTAVEWPILKLG